MVFMDVLGIHFKKPNISSLADSKQKFMPMLPRSNAVGILGPSSEPRWLTIVKPSPNGKFFLMCHITPLFHPGITTRATFRRGFFSKIFLAVVDADAGATALKIFSSGWWQEALSHKMNCKEVGKLIFQDTPGNIQTEHWYFKYSVVFRLSFLLLGSLKFPGSLAENARVELNQTDEILRWKTKL